MSIWVLGRFPPPFDGQAIATKRVGDLLDGVFDVRRVDIQPRDVSARTAHGISPGRLVHYAALRRRLANELRPDPEGVVIWPAISPDLAGHLRDMYAVIPAVRKYDRVFAVIHRGNFDKLFESPLTRLTAKRVVDEAAGFVFLTEGLSQRCSRWIPDEKRFVIPNTIDEDLLFSNAEVAEKQRPTRVRTRLLYLSNMIPSKGYLDVVEAVLLLTQRGLAVELTMVGSWLDDRDRENLQRRVRNARLLECVSHLGAVSDRRQIKELYRQSDVLVLPSYYPNEAQPLVIIEALNAGVPVISTFHGSIPEMISDGVEGALVEPKQPAAIADSVLRITAENQWIEYSRAARRRFEDVFAPARIRSRWEMLIRETASPKRRPSTSSVQ